MGLEVDWTGFYIFWKLEARSWGSKWVLVRLPHPVIGAIKDYKIILGSCYIIFLPLLQGGGS